MNTKIIKEKIRCNKKKIALAICLAGIIGLGIGLGTGLGPKKKDITKTEKSKPDTGKDKKVIEPKTETDTKKIVEPNKTPEDLRLENLTLQNIKGENLGTEINNILTAFKDQKFTLKFENSNIVDIWQRYLITIKKTGVIKTFDLHILENGDVKSYVFDNSDIKYIVENVKININNGPGLIAICSIISAEINNI